MNKIILDIDFPPHVQKEAMLALLELDSDATSVLLYEVILLFLDLSPTKMQNILKALASNDFAQLAFEAHALKSAAANLGLEPLRAACEEMEEWGMEASPQQAPMDLGRLNQAMQSSCEFLDKLRLSLASQIAQRKV